MEDLSQQIIITNKDLWEALKEFRKGTSGRKIANHNATKLGRKYYTAEQAADAAVEHVAAVKGGYVARPTEITTFVLQEHELRGGQERKGRLQDLPSKGKNI